MQFHRTQDGFTLSCGGIVLMNHRLDSPAIAVGSGEPTISAMRGHFSFEDSRQTRTPLPVARFDNDGVTLHTASDAPPLARLSVTGDAALIENLDKTHNRLWFVLSAQADEAIYGCGEQMSYLQLRGRRFPIWTAEPGIGRDPGALGMEDTGFQPFIGDYWTTYFPQPAFASTRGYQLHCDTTAYAEFDFTRADRHEIAVWNDTATLRASACADIGKAARLAARSFGPQPALPGWLREGAIVGLKDGVRSFDRLDAMIDAGVAVSAVWCEDWAGIRETGFGRRLFWDWRRDEARYPDLPERIAGLRSRGIGFMGYVNPYLCIDGTFFAEAHALGHFVRNRAGDPYLTDFGEFTCGQIDLTSPAACDWFIDTIVGPEMLDIGMAGWMADFGEYLPVDAVLADGSDPLLSHNRWPVLWAKLNRTAIARHDNGTQPLFFMRSGHAGVQAHCPLVWAGDQSVDFSRHDGIGTALCAALSAGIGGVAHHHGDIGGYTSIGDKVRSPELLMRWTELACFSAAMRTHEGNRPDANLQVDSTPELLAHFAAFTRLHRALAPYIARSLTAGDGLPLQRAMVLHYPAASAARDMQDQFLFGPDLLIAPVLEPDARERHVWLPPDGAEWTDFWTGQRIAGNGEYREVPAPLGRPPLFYRASSAMAPLFRAATDGWLF